MNKRQFIYAITLFSFIFFFCFEGKTEIIRFSELNDSLRLKIRLTSHILIPASEIESYEHIIDSGTPFAIDCRKYESDFNLGAFDGLFQNKKILILTKNDSLFSKFPSAIQISQNDFDLFELTDSITESYSTWPDFTCNELLIVETKKKYPGTDELFRLWKFRSKKPNFILLPNQDLNQGISLIKKLNRQPAIFGIVSSNEKPLANVLLKDKPNQIINGYFSLPLFERLMLKPYKAGYQFSPDVIYNAPNNEKNMKVFRAIRLENSFGLSYHFCFNRKVKNLARSADEGFIVQNVHFAKDKQLGPVAFFDNAFVDAGLESQQILNAAFSISVWIKPTQLGKNNSILGKGTNFVLKIHEGNLTFTMAGIKDYISLHSNIPVDKWTHVAVVYSEIERNLKFYLNGEKTDQISLIADYAGSDHSLLIGSNLWEEFFVGYMGDVKIWERELNEQEIQSEFQLSPGEKRNWKAEVISLILLFFSVSVYFIVRKKRKASAAQIVETEELHEKASNQTGNERISCFGNLKIICEDGTDLSLKLSPKLKQLFILILLNSGPGKKGISSKKMSEFLWPGMNETNAKNTRGTSIQNLRQALAPCDKIGISFKDKMWTLQIEKSVSCDLFEVENILARLEVSTDFQKEISKINQLTSLLKSGKLFQSIESSWLDEIKDQFSSRLVEFCLKSIETLEGQYAHLRLDLAGIISLYDELNETALKTKLNILTAQGKHGLAKSVYESFTKLYAELYDRPYLLEFIEIVNS